MDYLTGAWNDYGLNDEMRPNLMNPNLYQRGKGELHHLKVCTINYNTSGFCVFYVRRLHYLHHWMLLFEWIGRAWLYRREMKLSNERAGNHSSYLISNQLNLIPKNVVQSVHLHRHRDMSKLVNKNMMLFIVYSRVVFILALWYPILNSTVVNINITMPRSWSVFFYVKHMNY